MEDLPLIFKNKEHVHLRNEIIKEYDIRNGGFNISKKYGLITEDEIKLLDNYDRHEKHVYLGNKGKDPKFTDSLHKGFIREVTNFREANSVETDNIISIKKDSVLLFDTKVVQTCFDNVEFTLRGSFTSYLRIGKFEFLYNGNDDTLSTKGFNENVTTWHPLIDEVKKIIRASESSRPEKLFYMLKEFRENYIERKFINSMYYELSPVGGYKLVDTFGNRTYFSEVAHENDTYGEYEIDVSYNYINILLPLFKILL